MMVDWTEIGGGYFVDPDQADSPTKDLEHLGYLWLSGTGTWTFYPDGPDGKSFDFDCAGQRDVDLRGETGRLPFIELASGSGNAVLQLL